MNSTPNNQCGRDNMNCCKPTRPCDCDCEALQAQIDELREELANKADNNLIWHDLPVRPGFEMAYPPKYAKDSMGFVHFTGYLSKQGGAIPNNETFADLPEGFYIYDQAFVVGLVFSRNSITYGESGLVKMINGELQICAPLMAERADYAISFYGAGFYIGNQNINT